MMDSPPKAFGRGRSLGSARMVSLRRRSIVRLLLALAVACVSLALVRAEESPSPPDAPLVWKPGPDSSGNPFVESFALSPDAASYTATLCGVPEATLRVGHLATLANQGEVPSSVTARGDSVAAFGSILEFRVEFRSVGTDVLAGSLDLRQPEPVVSLGRMPSGGQYAVAVVVRLASGVGASDLPATVAFGVEAWVG